MQEPESRCHTYFVWPLPWLRGSGDIDGDWVVLTDERAEAYQPSQSDSPLTELARIRDPHESLGFIKRFGMLRHGPDSPSPRRERFAEWTSVARDLTEIMQLCEALQLTSAVESGRTSELADRADVRAHRHRNPDMTVLEAAGDLVAGRIARRVESITLTVSSANTWRDGRNRLGPPGEFVVSGRPQNLVEWAYHDLMLAVAETVPFATCEECERMFVRNHARRRFCGDRCGNRARQRRHLRQKALP